MATPVDLAVSCLGLLVVMRAAWTDFCTLRIPNRDVLMLLGLVALLLLPGVTSAGWINLVPGLLLFVLGVVFWFCGAMGAGDAKLFLPLGVLVGWQGVPLFAFLLLPCSLLLLGFMAAARRGWLGTGFAARRLAVIGEKGGVPYAVPMAAAGCVAVVWRLLQP